jgi:hypothetical protein
MTVAGRVLDVPHRAGAPAARTVASDRSAGPGKARDATPRDATPRDALDALGIRGETSRLVLVSVVSTAGGMIPAANREVMRRGVLNKAAPGPRAPKRGAGPSGPSRATSVTGSAVVAANAAAPMTIAVVPAARAVEAGTEKSGSGATPIKRIAARVKTTEQAGRMSDPMSGRTERAGRPIDPMYGRSRTIGSGRIGRPTRPCLTR